MVQDGFLAHIDFIALFAIDWGAFVLLFNQPHKVTHLALERHVRHQAVAGLGVQARHVARIGIAIRVAVFDIKNQNKVVTVGKVFIGAHAAGPSEDGVLVEALSSVFLVKKSCRWW